METSPENETGIYIAYPTSLTLKSIYRPKNYKTKVNDQHTKVGITKKSFSSRRKGYVDNFDNEVVFIPIATVRRDQIDEAEDLILSVIRKKYTMVGRAREWFNTPNREKIIEMIFSSLAASEIDYKRTV